MPHPLPAVRTHRGIPQSSRRNDGQRRALRASLKFDSFITYPALLCVISGTLRGAVISPSARQPRYALHINPTWLLAPLMAGLMLVGLSLRKRLTHKKRKAFTIAIDGPAGSGKSAVAEMLASRLSG